MLSRDWGWGWGWGSADRLEGGFEMPPRRLLGTPVAPCSMPEPGLGPALALAFAPALDCG